MRKITDSILLLVFLLAALLSACGGGSTASDDDQVETDFQAEDGTQLQPGPTEPGRIVSGDSWIKGDIYLPASVHSLGLILIEHDDPNNLSSWIPYSRHSSTDGAILRDTTVYFKLLEVSLGDLGVFVAADSLRRASPTTIMGISEVLQLIRGKSIFPHDLYPDHEHVSGFHVPGHIIRIIPPSRSVEVKWGITNNERQLEQYELVEFEYKGGNKEITFVPAGWVTALSDTSKNYFFDFYTATLKDSNNASRKVLRSYSVEHSHAGHVVNVTLTPQ